MNNIENIFIGFKNLIFKDEKIEAEAEKKLKICFECPNRKVSKCGLCGCWIETKTRSPKSKCPDSRW